MTCSFCPHSVAVVSTQSLTEMSSLGGKVRLASRPVLVVPNVKVKVGSPTFVICRGKAVIAQLSASQVGPHTTLSVH